MQSMMKLNQKLTKMFDTAWEKDLCKNLGVKEGGKCLLNGGIFSRTYGNNVFMRETIYKVFNFKYNL